MSEQFSRLSTSLENELVVIAVLLDYTPPLFSSPLLTAVQAPPLFSACFFTANIFHQANMTVT